MKETDLENGLLALFNELDSRNLSGQTPAQVRAFFASQLRSLISAYVKAHTITLTPTSGLVVGTTPVTGATTTQTLF